VHGMRVCPTVGLPLTPRGSHKPIGVVVRGAI
jgi:hypothetical protein